MWLYSIQQLHGCDNIMFAFAKVKWKSEDKKEYFDFPNIVIVLSWALSLVCPFCHLLKDSERQEKIFYKFVVVSSACFVGVCWGNCVGAGDTNRWVIWSRKLALWLATNWTYLKICGREEVTEKNKYQFIILTTLFTVYWTGNGGLSLTDCFSSTAKIQLNIYWHFKNFFASTFSFS